MGIKCEGREGGRGQMDAAVLSSSLQVASGRQFGEMEGDSPSRKIKAHPLPRTNVEIYFLWECERFKFKMASFLSSISER